MNRRRYLVAVGGVTSAIVGGTVTADEHNEDDNDTEDTAPETELQFGDRQMVVDHSGFSPEAYAVVEVENVGRIASGEVSITVGWLDEADSRIDDDSVRLPSLEAGETWLAHIQTFTDPVEIEDFEVVGEFETGYPRSPAGLTVAESDHRVDDEEIVGRVENTRETDLDRLEVQGMIYDANGRVLGGGTDWERDLPAGRDLTFEIRLPGLPEVVENAEDYEIPESTDHNVRLDARTHRIIDPTQQ